MLSIIGMGKVITFTETFDYVKTIWPAKSNQYHCKTRVDLNEGLIGNEACKVDYIEVYNKDKMWIGSLPGVDAYDNIRYTDYDTDRYKGKGKSVYVAYDFSSNDASDDNSWAVSCPNGMVKYIDNVYYRCKKPYNCDADMYAIDEISCSSLPDNAHRNKKSGYSCNNGYVMLNNGYCEEKAKCSENELYDEKENTCHSRPENSHFIKNSFDWECNVGYVQQGYVCEEIVKCDTATRYNADNNTCVELPDFAEWVDSISSEWTCNTGYIRFGNGCVVKAICSWEQRYDENLNSCIDPYPNSRWTGVNDYYVCDGGYVDMGNGNCEEKADCDHYNDATNSCYEKPTNSHWAYSTGSEWECDDGFHEGYNECIKCSGDAQYDPSSRECVEKPNNSHWIFEGRWMCDDEFVEMNGYCEEIASCGFFEEYNSYNNTCISKPLNLTDHVRDFMEYVHFTHDMGMDVGVGSFKDNYDESQVLINIGMDYNIGISIGSDNVKVRLQGSVAFLYTLLDYSAPDTYYHTNESIMALLGLYGFNVGLDLWKITLAYSYLFVAQSELDNISFNKALHKIRAGFMLNEHWDAHLAVIPNLIKSTSIMKTYNNTWYHIGMTYRF